MMSEWDEGLPSGKEKNNSSSISGSWDVLQTVMVLIITAAAAFLTAYVTRDNPSRPFWLLALCFAVPVAALLLSAFVKEKLIPTMTPNTSRGAQLILVLCSIFAAAVVGCFSQVSNQEARLVKEVTQTGWNNVLIILDKSGSMSIYERDENATEAVIELINSIEEGTDVGLLIDVDWNETSIQHIYDIQPLDDSNRNRLITAAQFRPTGGANFGQALNTAAEMLEATADPGSYTILYISDGTDPLRAEAYSSRFTSLGVKINYLYVDENHSDDLARLAALTGGESIFAAKADELVSQMQRITTYVQTSTIYKDALRDIDESSTAKTVTAILLLLLGILIGLTLTVMFSVQGQRRFQLILSPVMAVIAFLLLAFGKDLIPAAWIREGVAFSLLGLVFMKSNRGVNGRPAVSTARKANPAPATHAPVSPDEGNDW